MLVNSVEKMSTNIDKGGNTDHIIAGQMYKRLSEIFSHIAEMLLYHFFPPSDNIDVIAHQHVETAQLDHLLQADHNHIGLIDRKIEQFIQIPCCDFIWVNDIAIPGEDIHDQLFIIVVFCLIQDAFGDVVVEVGSFGILFLES